MGTFRCGEQEECQRRLGDTDSWVKYLEVRKFVVLLLIYKISARQNILYTVTQLI